MKKTILLISSILTSLGVFAQYQAGNILLTGTVIFKSEQSKTSNGGTTNYGPKTTTFEVGPGFEYFLSDKFAFGAEIDFTNEKVVDDSPGGGLDQTIDKTTITSIAPFASMYFINEERFALFCKLGAGFGFGKNIYETKNGATTVSNEVKISALEIALRPGVAVHLSEKFGMTATFGALSYASYKVDNGTTERTSTEYGLELSPSLGFGIYYKLR